MTRQTKSILFWKRRMSSKSYISWDLLCESHIFDKYVVFCGKYVCNTSCSERTLNLITIQTFLQIFDFVDIKVVKSERTTNINSWNIIIWWKHHHLLVSHNFSSLNIYVYKQNQFWLNEKLPLWINICREKDSP